MAEFEEQLDCILSDPEAMSQIMNIARTLTGNGDGGGEMQPLPMEASEREQQSDSGAYRKVNNLVGSSNGRDSKGMILMEALKPYLREEKRRKLDRALKMAGTTRLIRNVIRTMGEGGQDV